MPKDPKLTIAKDPDSQIAIEVMEQAIVDIAEGARKLLGSRLSRRAVIVLLKDSSGESMETIGRVLNAAATLDKTYLK